MAIPKHQAPADGSGGDPNVPAAPREQSVGLVGLVDDDDQVCAALGDGLELLNIASASFGSAEAMLQAVVPRQGLLWLRGADGDCALLAAAVIDLHLPGIHGCELARRLLLVSPDLRVVLITAAHEDERVPLCGDLDAAIWLKKPFALDDLERALLPG